MGGCDPVHQILFPLCQKGLKTAHQRTSTDSPDIANMPLQGSSTPGPDKAPHSCRSCYQQLPCPVRQAKSQPFPRPSSNAASPRAMPCFPGPLCSHPGPSGLATALAAITSQLPLCCPWRTGSESEFSLCAWHRVGVAVNTW